MTLNASLARSFDSTPPIASTSSSLPSPVTPTQMTLEKLREAVGHLDTRVNESKRKDMIHIVCDKLVEVSFMKKILFNLESLFAISTISSDSWNSSSTSGRVFQKLIITFIRKVLVFNLKNNHVILYVN